MFLVIFNDLGGTWDKAVFAVTDTTIRVAMVVMPLFILVQCFIAAYKFMSGKAELMDAIERVLICIFFFFFLLSYKPAMQSCSYLIVSIADYIANANEVTPQKVSAGISTLPTSDTHTSFIATLASSGALGAHSAIGYALYEEAEDIYEGASNIFTLKSFLLTFITDAITGFIRLLVELLSYALTGVLIILGPLAIMFETAPWIGQGIFKHWFTSWLSLKCWLITMSVIDSLIDAFHNAYVASALQESFNMDMFIGTLQQAVLPIVFIILYIMTPKLTSYYIRGDGGGLFSGMLAGASTVAAVGATVATGGVGGLAKLGMAGGMGSGGTSMGMNQMAQSMKGISSQLEQFQKQLDNLDKDK